jgi:hypothetical protein
MLMNWIYPMKLAGFDHCSAVVESMTSQMRSYVSGNAWQTTTTGPVSVTPCKVHSTPLPS